MARPTKRPKAIPTPGAALPDTSKDYDTMIGVKASEAPNSLVGFMDDEDVAQDDLDQQQTWEKLWGGMPKYQPRNTEPIKQLMLNFDSWEDYWKFANLIDFALTEKTKSIYYPPRTTTVLDVFRWVDDGDAAAEEAND